MRRVDAAFATTSGLFQGGVKPPHSKALRAGSWFLGGRQPTGMRDCFENACAGGTLECGGSTPPLRLPQVYSKAASSRRTPRRCAQGHGFRVVVSRQACATVLKMLVREAPWNAAGRRRLCDYLRSIPRRRQAAALQGAARRVMVSGWSSADGHARLF
jgi:hypothetical protein